MMKMSRFQVASSNFKQAIISGGRVIMTTADESRLLNSLYVETSTRSSVIEFNSNAVYLRE